MSEGQLKGIAEMNSAYPSWENMTDYVHDIPQRGKPKQRTRTHWHFALRQVHTWRTISLWRVSTAKHNRKQRLELANASESLK